MHSVTASRGSVATVSSVYATSRLGAFASRYTRPTKQMSAEKSIACSRRGARWACGERAVVCAAWAGRVQRVCRAGAACRCSYPYPTRTLDPTPDAYPYPYPYP